MEDPAPRIIRWNGDISMRSLRYCRSKASIGSASGGSGAATVWLVTWPKEKPRRRASGSGSCQQRCIVICGCRVEGWRGAPGDLISTIIISFIVIIITTIAAHKHDPDYLSSVKARRTCLPTFNSSENMSKQFVHNAD